MKRAGRPVNQGGTAGDNLSSLGLGLGREVFMFTYDIQAADK